MHDSCLCRHAAGLGRTGAAARPSDQGTFRTFPTDCHEPTAGGAPPGSGRRSRAAAPPQGIGAFFAAATAALKSAGVRNPAALTLVAAAVNADT